MFTQLRMTFLIGLLATAALFLGACADDEGGEDGDTDTNGGGTTATETAEAGGDTGDGDGTTIDVSLTDPTWAVVPSTSSASAGDVTFNVTNEGTTPHNLMVIATDLPADQLPTEAGQVVTDDMEVLVETDDFAAGEGGEETAELEAGDYVLICNVAGHYDLGMHTAFTVN